MCLLAMAACLVSQGVPFVHAGDDILRSKSLDRDSYNSGDWFNRVRLGRLGNMGLYCMPSHNANDMLRSKLVWTVTPTIQATGLKGCAFVILDW
jgi:hypothetical protein